ncbi:uncharacterized protein JCM6883_000623 [Sporobolomyces salmoneus]|uniref:uncharacterized protein n=1 Tax=Sporobolomyces salmoneus TaxID=183962 RepID=UPI00317A983E
MQLAKYNAEKVLSLDEFLEEDEDELDTEKTPLNGGKRIDTDAVIQELTDLQTGTVILSSLTFLLTLVELVCV